MLAHSSCFNLKWMSEVDVFNATTVCLYSLYWVCNGTACSDNMWTGQGHTTGCYEVVRNIIHKIREYSWPTEKLIPFQEWFSCVKLISTKILLIRIGTIRLQLSVHVQRHVILTTSYFRYEAAENYSKTDMTCICVCVCVSHLSEPSVRRSGKMSHPSYYASHLN